jgi:DNA invertase Pin-like site-specific DNA recombinase
MKTERKVAIYARVSTNSGQNPEMQIRELRESCKNRSWKIAGEFIDSGISGATDSRPQLNRLMAEAHRRQFDVVAVWDFSRFARSTSHLLRALETFSSLGIGFVSLREQIDTSVSSELSYIAGGKLLQRRTAEARSLSFCIPKPCSDALANQ